MVECFVSELFMLQVLKDTYEVSSLAHRSLENNDIPHRWLLHYHDSHWMTNLCFWQLNTETKKCRESYDICEMTFIRTTLLITNIYTTIFR